MPRKIPEKSVYVVFLEWQEVCFQANGAVVRLLRAHVPEGSRVIWARNERMFLKALPEATHALVWYFKESWFVHAPKLRVLATPAAGRELVPSKGPKGVRIHFGHFHGDVMAESAAAFVLAWARGFLLKSDSVWPRIWMSERIYDVAGTKAVVIGYGNVGRAVGRKFKALGVEVFGYSRRLRIPQTELDLRLRQADWLVLALPGGAETNKLFNSRMIAKLPRRCVVLNVGRGSTVDEGALFSALASKRLAGAYLDVRTTEPYKRFALPGGTEGLPPTPQLENLVLMPHAAAFSPQYMRRFILELEHDGCL